MPAPLEMVLPAAPESAAAARQVVRGLPLPEQLADEVALLVTELVSNSIRHADMAPLEEIHIQLLVNSEGVRVAVTDPGPGFDRHRPVADLTEPGGLGLVLVDRLADRWGVDNDDDTTVWFEIGRSPPRFAHAC